MDGREAAGRAGIVLYVPAGPPETIARARPRSGPPRAIRRTPDHRQRIVPRPTDSRHGRLGNDRVPARRPPSWARAGGHPRLRSGRDEAVLLAPAAPRPGQ